MIKPLGIFRCQGVLSAYYTIPKINRELQHPRGITVHTLHYTIPKINRELQPFIRCQKNVFLGEQILKKVLTNSF